MEEVFTNGPMDKSIQENGDLIRWMEEEHLLMVMELLKLGNILMIKKLVDYLNRIIHL